MASLTATQPPRAAWPDRPALALTGLAVALALACTLWLLAGLPEARRGFILHLRLDRLAGLLIVGAAVGVSTVLFQTVAANRVLTPSIMGFDALFVLVQGALVAGLGVTGFSAVPAVWRFWFAVAGMVALAAVLFVPLLARGARDVPRMILTGLVLGVLFRSLSAGLARVMDPNAFAVVQGVSVASFARIDPALLPWAGSITVAACAAPLALSPRIDVLALGRPVAVSLGLRSGALTVVLLGLVTLLVAASTALVGPVAFFGLIVAGLAHAAVGSPRHRLLLPAAAMIAALVLVAGQMLFERALGQAGTLSVVIEFAGGLFFLALLLSGRVR